MLAVTATRAAEVGANLGDRESSCSEPGQPSRADEETGCRGIHNPWFALDADRYWNHGPCSAGRLPATPPGGAAARGRRAGGGRAPGEPGVRRALGTPR